MLHTPANGTWTICLFLQTQAKRGTPDPALFRALQRHFIWCSDTRERIG